MNSQDLQNAAFHNGPFGFGTAENAAFVKGAAWAISLTQEELLFDGLTLDQVKTNLALLNADDLRALVISQLIMMRISDNCTEAERTSNAPPRQA